jgi:hypothetical protein
LTVATDFFLEDEAEGWWHCPSPLRCAIVDGPSVFFDHRPDALFPETYWLVRTDPAIEWHGDDRFAPRWGPDHQLCRPIEPTPFALVMASSSWTGPINLARASGVPAYPVAGVPRVVSEAKPIGGLAMKVGVRRGIDVMD